MYNVADVKKMIGSATEDKLNTAISKGALKLSENQINTVSFIFWLCYLAERDLEASIKLPWDILSKKFPKNVFNKAKEILSEIIFDRKNSLTLENVLACVQKEIAEKIRICVKDNYNEKPHIGIDNMPSFGDKIKLYEGIFFKNNVVAILWKIKNIRDDFSHGRIDDLKYNNELLTLRTTKEKILIDYMEAVSNPDHSQSQLRDKLRLTSEQDKEIIKLFDQL